MPTIYLRHPVHGTKVAIAHEEARADMRNGWVEFDPTARKPEPAPVAEPTELPAPVEFLAKDVGHIKNALPARRGRARKSVEPQEE
jgi:hypothetical protein